MDTMQQQHIYMYFLFIYRHNLIKGLGTLNNDIAGMDFKNYFT